MRMIQVSTAVYAAIWAARQAGEESETEILARLLECGDLNESNSITSIGQGTQNAPGSIGYYDSRNNVSFPEGLAIFRRYKGCEYSAVATRGSWVRNDTGQSYRTLNRLNQSIVSGQENVWNGNWFYRDHGKERSIETLRRS